MGRHVLSEWLGARGSARPSSRRLGTWPGTGHVALAPCVVTEVQATS